MTRTLLVSSLLVLATVATPSIAAAGQVWVNSPAQSIPYNCATKPNAALATQVGWVNDTANPLKTGDRGYIHAVAQAVDCNNGAEMEVLLPAGAVLDTSKTMYCIREKLDGTKDPIGNCAPWGIPGPNGGLKFTNGAVALAPDWYLELQIPIIYNAELLGAAGGNNALLGVKTQSLMGYALPTVPVSVGYRALLQNYSSNVSTTSVQLNVNLFSFYKAGSLSFEYGTTINLGQSTPPATVAAGSVNYPNANAMLTGIAPSTTYFWRARFVTASGTFYSETQAFTSYTPVLTLATAGRGLGRITSNPIGLDCGSGSSNVCSANIAPSLTITLYAAPSTPGYTFTGWSGACTGSGPCTVTMNDSKSVTASFDFFSSSSGTPLPNPGPGTPRR